MTGGGLSTHYRGEQSQYVRQRYAANTGQSDTEGESSFNVVGSWPYLYDVTDEKKGAQVPPLGMRSSVPLGGLGTGSVELRANGAFADWQLENEGPALFEHGKIPVKEEMLLGLKAGNVAKFLATHPPDQLPGVQGLRYAGGVPVSKLEGTYLTLRPVAVRACTQLPTPTLRGQCRMRSCL